MEALSPTRRKYVKEAERCATSPQPTFDDWLARHQNQLYRYALHLTRDRADADALYEETVLTAYRRFDQIDGRAEDRAWLYRIATKAFLSKQHTRRMKPSVVATKPEVVPAATSAIRLGRRSQERHEAGLPEYLPIEQRLA